MQVSKKIKREIIEWAVFITVIGGLFLTGLHTEVFGFLQRGVLATGLIKPAKVVATKTADYAWDVRSVDDQTHPISKWKGKTIFINFWATWCPPCIAEMPDIQNLVNEMGDEIVFLMVSLDEDSEKALRFVERKNYNFPVYFPASGIPTVYQISSIPTTYVISPSGKIVVETHGMAKYNSAQFRDFLRGLE